MTKAARNATDFVGPGSAGVPPAHRITPDRSTSPAGRQRSQEQPSD
jgi:hypothetical protein